MRWRLTIAALAALSGSATLPADDAGAAQVRLTLSVEGHVVVSWSLEEASTLCKAFRETGNCSADGPRQPGGDKPCGVTVRCRAGACPSGYCECRDGERLQPVDCRPGSRGPFTCNEKCVEARAQLRYAPAGGDLSGARAVRANITRWRKRLWSSAELPDLVQGAAYTYQCKRGNGSSFGPEFQLWAPPATVQELRTHSDSDNEIAIPAVRVAVFGDLVEGSGGVEIIQRAVAGPAIDAAIHLGGISDEHGHKGDGFISMIRPIASRVPYMTLPGDQDEAFFRMPGRGSGARAEEPWYAFNIGRARVVMLSTAALSEDAGWRPGHRATARRRQLLWLEQELASSAAPSKRSRRPWLLVAGHRPMYCSLQQPTCGPEAAKLRALLEPLFRQYNVNLYMSAHVHAYERTFPVFNKALCPQSARKPMRMLRRPCAPVYVVNGAGGFPPLQYDENFLPASWTAQRHAGTLGFGELTIHNATHLQYRQLEASGAVTDDFWLRQPRGEDGSSEMEENFLEAVTWLAFATGVLTGTVGFIRWAHGDGLRRHDEALRELRVEISVLSGVPCKVWSAAEHHEVQGLAEGGAAGRVEGPH